MKVKYGPYSPSRLDTANCPLRFKHEYMDQGDKGPASLPSRRGNAIHDTFEEITKGWISDKALNWEQVEEILTEKIKKYQVAQEDITTCIGAAKAYMSNPPEGLDHILGTEEALAVKWDDKQEDFVECPWNDPDAYARGKIDILQVEGTTATIIDHKTQMYVCKANTFQMGFYAWIVKKFYPYITEVKTILHFCHPELDRYSYPEIWTEEDLSMHESEIKIRIARAETLEDFTPQPNDGCVYCPLKMNCPMIAEGPKLKTKFGKVKNAPIISASEAQEVASVLQVLDENRKVLNSRLQAFTREIGPVIIPGKEFGYKKTEGWKVDYENREPLFNLLKESGINPFEYFDVNMTAMKKNIWKTSRPAFIEKIKEHLRATVNTRFGSRRV